MSDSNKMTPLERLSNIFTGIFNKSYEPEHKEPILTQEPQKEVLSSSNVDDVMLQDRSIQQFNFLKKPQLSIFREMNERRMMYEGTRTQQFYDYDMMSNYPDIGAGLNLLSEESTTKGDNGRMLNIYSDNKRVKMELERLFYKVLDINTNLPFWCRNMIKLGDNFVYLDLEEGNGVTGALQLSNIDIERIEEEKDGKIKVKFKNKIRTNQEYVPYQIAHFRMLGDDRCLPYGMSVLAKLRRVFKMLMIAEDGWLVYVITRVAERRIYKVNVKGITNLEDRKQMMQLVASQAKKAPVYNQNGELNMKYHALSQDEDLFIPTESDNATNPVDTLPGAQNIDKIEYIKYLKDMIYTGLEIPRPFLSFGGETTSDGGGKNLSMLDIRFAKKVNRIQESLLAELNKIAVIHLHTLGGDFSKEADNFVLSLTNPSTQSEILKVELLSAKADLAEKLNRTDDTGVKLWSRAKIMKEIFGWSFDELREDLLDQAVESKIADEIKSFPSLLKTSGVYDDLIKKMNLLKQTTTSNGQEGGGDMGGSQEGGIPVAPEEGNTPADETNITERYILENKKFLKEIDNLLKG